MPTVVLCILLLWPAFGATNRTVTVKPSGGDYTSLAAAIAGEKGDLVEQDRQLTIELYAMADTTAASITHTDWVTDATRYILLTVPASERHPGYYSTAKYRLEVGGANPLTIQHGQFVAVDGLQIYTTSGDYAALAMNTNGGSTSAVVTIRNCILRGTTSVTNKGVLNFGGIGNAGRTYYVYNNLIYKSYTTTTSGRGIQLDVLGSFYVWNNTIAEVGQGLIRNNGTVIAVNNLISATQATASGTFEAGTNYNASNRSTMGYTVTGGGNANDRTSQTFTFVNSGSGNYHLASGDTGARGYGIADPGNGAFSNDIDNESRSGSWDIGCDQYVVASTGRPFLIVVTDQ
jgi:hypothetical protein